MNENIFRAYDIRGNAEQDLTPDVLVKIGFVLGNKVKEVALMQYMLVTIAGFHAKESLLIFVLG